MVVKWASLGFALCSIVYVNLCFNQLGNSIAQEVFLSKLPVNLLVMSIFYTLYQTKMYRESIAPFNFTATTAGGAYPDLSVKGECDPKMPPPIQLKRRPNIFFISHETWKDHESSQMNWSTLPYNPIYRKFVSNAANGCYTTAAHLSNTTTAEAHFEFIYGITSTHKN
jgi:hypothetical protein